MEADQSRQKNLTIPLGNLTKAELFYSQMIEKNSTLYLHFQVDTVDVHAPNLNLDSEEDLPRAKFRSSIPMVKYMKRKKEQETVSLMDSSFGDIPPPKQKEASADLSTGNNDTKDDDNVYPHWKTLIDLNLIFDATFYNTNGPMPSEMARVLKVDWDTMSYAPIIYMSDFWLLKKNMVLLNDTLYG